MLLSSKSFAKKNATCNYRPIFHVVPSLDMILAFKALPFLNFIQKRNSHKISITLIAIKTTIKNTKPCQYLF